MLVHVSVLAVTFCAQMHVHIQLYTHAHTTVHAYTDAYIVTQLHLEKFDDFSRSMFKVIQNLVLGM